MYSIKINEKVYTVSEGTLLSDALMSIGGNAHHPCGGKGICQKCTVLVDGKEELSCQYVINSDISVSLPEERLISTDEKETIIAPAEDILCLDIGTTTLAMEVLSSQGEELSCRLIGINPQSIYGADVISRIEYCTKNGVEPLQATLVAAINESIEYSATTADKMYVSGNTTMLHTLLGVDCSSMGTYPYKPQFLESRCISAESIGIRGVKWIETLPCISAFIGADIVAGINCLEAPSEGKYNLLIDLGTNAEIALVGRDEVITTSAAAGPCLEGVGISCGMSATSGAIYSYSEQGYRAMGHTEPRGICGTGLIDIVAHLLRKGIVDETGYMEDSYEIADGVTITEGDIRQYQLAKSAICSGIVALLRSNNISFDMIDRVYISGGFSQGINIDNAVYTGLLPRELREKGECINNSSLKGTVKYALGKDDLSWIFTARYDDMSQNTLFSELFIENMSFYNE